MLVYPKELLIEFPKIPTAPCPALSLEAENPICLNLETAGKSGPFLWTTNQRLQRETGTPNVNVVVVEKPLGGFEPKT